jgi:hypothetical protein
MTEPEAPLAASDAEADRVPDLHDRMTRIRLTPAAMSAIVKLSRRWSLTADDTARLLGDVTADTWRAWQTTPPTELSVDQLTRVSLLLGIAADLHRLFDGGLADDWIRRPNGHPSCEGRSPLDVMIADGVTAMAKLRALTHSRVLGL